MLGDDVADLVAQELGLENRRRVRIALSIDWLLNSFFLFFLN